MMAGVEASCEEKEWIPNHVLYQDVFCFLLSFFFGLFYHQRVILRDAKRYLHFLCALAA